MDAYNSSDRVTRCLVAAAVLGGLCFGYVQLSSRWLDVERAKKRRMSSGAPIVHLTVADESVMSLLPPQAASAVKNWQRKWGSMTEHGIDRQNSLADSNRGWRSPARW